MAAHADATIFVIRELHTSERVVRRGQGALAAVNAHVVGVVLNFVRPRAGDAEPYFGAYLNQESAIDVAVETVTPSRTMPAQEPDTAPARSAIQAPHTNTRRDG